MRATRECHNRNAWRPPAITGSLPSRVVRHTRTHANACTPMYARGRTTKCAKANVPPISYIGLTHLKGTAASKSPSSYLMSTLHRSLEMSVTVPLCHGKEAPGVTMVPLGVTATPLKFCRRNRASTCSPMLGTTLECANELGGGALGAHDVNNVSPKKPSSPASTCKRVGESVIGHGRHLQKRSSRVLGVCEAG